MTLTWANVKRTRYGARQVLVTVLAIGALLTACSATALARISTSSATPAVAYQLNAGHTGVSADSVAATPKKLWLVTFSGAASYPLIVNGRVFVTVADTLGPTLYALDATTGKTLWGPILLGGSYSTGLAFDQGQVFTVNGSGVMEAFTAASGALDWAVQLPGQYSFTSAPTANGGYVYVGGAGDGGTVYAVNERTGAVAWTGSVENGDESSPAVSASGVYVSYACGQTYDFGPLTGALIWHRNTACEGGGGSTPVLAGRLLFVRDFDFPAVLNAATGALLGPFSSSGPAPAVDSARVYDLAGSTLIAASLSSGTIQWRFSGDGSLVSAPLVASGTVFIGGSTGELYALSSTTGTITWSTNVGSAITAPDGQPPSGLATSGGLLVVPAGQTLIAYR